MCYARLLRVEIVFPLVFIEKSFIKFFVYEEIFT